MEIRADLHIHTILSPCGDLEMSPANIIGIALRKGISLIGISDHNSTRQAPLIQEFVARKSTPSKRYTPSPTSRLWKDSRNFKLIWIITCRT